MGLNFQFICSHQGGTPSPSHISSTGPMSFLGSYPNDWSQVPSRGTPVSGRRSPLGRGTQSLVPCPFWSTPVTSPRSLLGGIPISGPRSLLGDTPVSGPMYFVGSTWSYHRSCWEGGTQDREPPGTGVPPILDWKPLPQTPLDRLSLNR